MRLRSESRRGRCRHRRRALAAPLAALLAACAAAPRAASPPALTVVQWSDDGGVVVVARARDRSLELSAHAGERGELRWRAEVHLHRATAPLELAVAPDGARAAVAAGGQLWLASRYDATPILLAAGPGATAPSFSPDGLAVAYVRDGALWLRELAAAEARRMTADGALVARLPGHPRLTDFRQAQRPPLPFAWSPDSRSLAYFGGVAAAPPRLWIVDVAAPAPRVLAAAQSPAGELRRAQWRFDARGLAVESLNPGEPLRRLQLCHAEKLYCRELALARTGSAAEPPDDFRFLADGFLWASPDGDPALARYDTLGRLRTFLLAPGERLVGVAALYEAADELLVRLPPRDDAGGAGSLLLLALKTGQRKSSFPAGVDEIVTSADGARRWVRSLPVPGSAGQLVLEAPDGARLAVLSPAAPDAASPSP